MKHPFSTALTLIALVSTPVLASDTTWTSTLSQAWPVSGNWSSGTPGASVGAIFADGSVQHTVDLLGAPVTTLGVSFNLFSGGSPFDIVDTISGNGLQLRAGGTANGILNNDDNTQVFDVPITMFSQNGLAGSFASQTWNAAAGGLVISGRYSASGVPTVNNSAGTITVTGSFNTTIGSATGRGDIIGNGGLIKNGSGTLTLGGTVANTYIGATTLNAGVLTIAKAGAIGAALVLNGGTLNLNGLNQNIGTPTLTGNSTLDFTGASIGHLLLPPGSNTVSFPDSHSVAWTAGTTLSILDWNPNEKLRFGTSSSALTAAQLGEIIFADQPFTPSGKIDANGFVTPVPEPSTAALGLVGGCALAMSFVARRRKV